MWKLPVERISSSDASTSGLSPAPFSSGSRAAAEQVERGGEAAVHLADAAERERVLEPPRRPWLREGSALEQLPEPCRAVRLPRCGPRGGDACVDRGQARAEALERERRRYLSGLEKLARVVQRERAARAGGRGRVDQRQAVLRRKLERSEPDPGERLARGQHLVAEPGLALPDQAEPDVGEHAEIAGADRAELRHDRLDPRVQQGDERLRDVGPRSRAAAGDPVRAHEHHRTDGVGRKRRADRVRAAANRLERDLRERVRVDSYADPRPEPGCQPVGLAPLREVALDDCAAGLDPRHGLRPERDGCSLPRHAHERLERQPVACQLDRRGHASVAVVYAGVVEPLDLTWLSEQDVERVGLGNDEILAAVESALLAQAAGEAVLEPRVHLEPDPAVKGHFNVLRASVAPLGLAGVKIVGDYVENYRLGLPSELGLLCLFDAGTGAPVAVIAAAALTEMRTGALTALGARHLARPGARVLGHVGARGTAYWNVRLLDHLFDFAEIRVHSRRPESREAFAARLAAELGKPVRATGSWEECLRGADVLVEASRLEQPEPHLRTEWVEPGALVIPYGTMSAVELSLTDVMDKVVVDDWGQARAGKLGALRAHVDSGRLSEETLYAELAELVAGQKPGRESDEERILFWHRGLGSSDVALGHALLERARELGLGQQLRVL